MGASNLNTNEEDSDTTAERAEGVTTVGERALRAVLVSRKRRRMVVESDSEEEAGGGGGTGASGGGRRKRAS